MLALILSKVHISPKLKEKQKTNLYLSLFSPKAKGKNKTKQKSFFSLSDNCIVWVIWKPTFMSVFYHFISHWIYSFEVVTEPQSYMSHLNLKMELQVYVLHWWTPSRVRTWQPCETWLFKGKSSEALTFQDRAWELSLYTISIYSALNVFWPWLLT